MCSRRVRLFNQKERQVTKILQYKCQTCSHGSPHLTWHLKNKPLHSFKTVRKNLQGCSWGFDCCCELRSENGTLLYIHSQRSLFPFHLLWHRLSVGHGQGRFTLEQKWSIPLEQGFLSVLRSQLWTFCLLLFSLIKPTHDGAQRKQLIRLHLVLFALDAPLEIDWKSVFYGGWHWIGVILISQAF